MAFPVLAGVPVAGVLQLNPGKVPVADELVQLVATKPIGQLPDGLVSDHRGVPANDMMQLKREVETLVGVPDVIARHDLLGYVEGFGDGNPLLIVGQALTLLVCANGEHADVNGFCKSALGRVSPPAQPLQGLPSIAGRFQKSAFSVISKKPSVSFWSSEKVSTIWSMISRYCPGSLELAVYARSVSLVSASRRRTYSARAYSMYPEEEVIPTASLSMICSRQ